MAELTVGAGVARGLMNFAIAKGADETALSESSGITAAEVADQDHRVPMTNYIALVRAAKELSGDPAIALHYGEEVDLSEVSIAGLIMNASADMREAFLQMNRFGRLVVEVETEAGATRFRHVVEDDQHWLVDTRANPNAFFELTEVTFARQICGLRRFLPRPFALEVHVTHPAPSYAAEYERIFRCPVVFDSRWNAMRTDPSLQSHKVALQPHYVFGVLSERARMLVKELENSKSTRGRVESLLMPMLHTGDISMDAIAAKMAISRQTLFRRLKAEDVTFEKCSTSCAIAWRSIISAGARPR